MELIDHLYGRLLAPLALAYSKPTPPPQSLRHRRHHRANLGRPTIPHRLQPGHGFDIGCRIYFDISLRVWLASLLYVSIGGKKKGRGAFAVFDEMTFSSSAFFFSCVVAAVFKKKAAVFHLN